MDTVNSMLNGESLNGKNYLLLKGDFTASYELALNYKGTNYGGYNFLTNNCVDYVHELLKAGDFLYSKMNYYINKMEPTIPLSYYYSLRTAERKAQAAVVQAVMYTVAKKTLKEIFRHARPFIWIL